MKKFMNSADEFLKESLQGFAAAHKDIVTCHYDPNFIIRSKASKEAKVALVTGGGSGHEPMHGGFVGYGMLDAACPGFIFSSPSPDQMIAAIEKVDSSSGVGLYVEESWTKVNVPTNSQIVNGMKQIISLKNKMADSARTRAVERYDIKDWLRKHREIIEKIYYTN